MAIKNTLDSKESFRESFYSRIKSFVGLGAAANAIDRPYKAAVRWGQSEEALPDIYEIALICAATGYRPDWLILGHGNPNFTKEESLLIEAMRRLDDKQKAAVNAQLEAFGVVKAEVERVLTNTPQLQIVKREPIPNKMKRNTRADYPTFHSIKPEIQSIRRIPHFVQLAAGSGRELERCDEVYAFREHFPQSNVHAATVRGISMMDTVRNGETILVQAFGENGMVLPSVESDDSTTPFEIVRRFVRDGDICILSVNDDDPTLKRINIFQRGKRWNLTLTADNPETDGYPRPISKDDKVTFWATMIGYVKRGDE